ncbi:hypothetical protein WJR50_01910 [Catalinimonas sp. 4WD22]|uniref:hypothetical protein n=1 Tax=Catalinimonas locisalis TaxID=3133978 RepID=UPI00310196BF
MHLSEAGTIAKDNLLMIPEQFNNTVLDEWVVMPNHIHMILIIDGGNMTGSRSMINHGPTKSGIPNNPMELPVDTIGKMMRWYKGKVSYECRKQGHTFAWQARPGRPGFTTISFVMSVLWKISGSTFRITL